MTLEDDDLVQDDPNDPSHPDHDLSEAAGYSPYDSFPKPWFLQRWVLILVAILVIASVLLSLLPRI